MNINKKKALVKFMRGRYPFILLIALCVVCGAIPAIGGEKDLIHSVPLHIALLLIILYNILYSIAGHYAEDEPETGGVDDRSRRA
ncbi:hypothetical protein ACFFGT_10280 [Mucilaginibacter angelicae]|uniref:Uncharacterized protein n=1 Tax=Mucilaginibacter angelicae TaxID=869718 RepID=A0ABV6L583_9SPHI